MSRPMIPALDTLDFVFLKALQDGKPVLLSQLQPVISEATTVSRTGFYHMARRVESFGLIKRNSVPGRKSVTATITQRGKKELSAFRASMRELLK